MSMTPLDGVRSSLANTLKGIERYNPNNIPKLEEYVDLQATENGYDLEANLALLKLYQFNPNMQNIEYVCKVLLKSLTNLPHTDFTLCKSLLNLEVLDDQTVKSIQFLADLLETGSFKEFWEKMKNPDLARLTRFISGFEDAMRKFVCHVISNMYKEITEERLCEFLGVTDEAVVNQWIAKNGWKSGESSFVLISKQEELIKTKKITEKIEMESVAGVMANCY